MAGSVNYDLTANVNTTVVHPEGAGRAAARGLRQRKADAVFETTAHTFDGFRDVGKYGLSESKYGIITSMKMEDCVLRTSEVGPQNVPLWLHGMAANYDPPRRLRSAPAEDFPVLHEDGGCSTRRRSTTTSSPRTAMH